LIEILVVVALIGLLIAIGLHSASSALCSSKAGAARTTLQVLAAAISAYKTDFGAYPGTGASLTADTTVFVKRLQEKNRHGEPYYRFRPEDLGSGGEFLSPFGEPYYYSIPGSPTPGPDGTPHASPYYLWTAGCRQSDPDRRWEINNWKP
jgi:type II secretory pathway pseudopilin PulG